MTRIEPRRPSPSQPVSPSRPPAGFPSATPEAESRSAPSVGVDRMVGVAQPVATAASAESVQEAHATARSRRAERGATPAARRPVAVNVYPEDPVVDVNPVRREEPRTLVRSRAGRPAGAWTGRGSDRRTRGRDPHPEPAEDRSAGEGLPGTCSAATS